MKQAFDHCLTMIDLISMNFEKFKRINDMLTDPTNNCILAVEDNPGDFFLVKEYLEEKFPNNKVCHAPDFKTASEYLNDNSRKFDVILLDLKLPDMQGIELIEGIFKLHKEVPVIVLTGNDDLEFSIRSISYGVSDYLIKDQLNPEILYKSIIFSIERKKINSKLKESEDRFERLFRESPEAMMVYDPFDFSNFMVNRACLKMLGYSEQEFLERKIFDMIHPEEREEVRSRLLPLDPWRKDLQSGIKYKLITKSGEIIHSEVYSAPLALNGRLYRSVIIIDVTEKYAFENRITKAIIKTQEDERYEIGSELHDNVCQLLAAVQMFISILKPSVKQEGLVMLEKVSDNTGIAIQEIRNLSHRLAPAFFSDSTLEDAVSRLIEDYSLDKEMNIKVVFSHSIRQKELNRDLILNLYRILQEQMRNIQKYAGATEVELNISEKGNDLVMVIKDNGVGFDTAVTKSGIGLANMRRRAELFGGFTSVRSSPGHGCELKIVIPIMT